MIRLRTILIASLMLAWCDGHLLFAQDGEPEVSASDKITTDSGEKEEATPEDKRLAVPDKAAIFKTQKLVRGIYKSELLKAKTPTKKQALAKKMISDGVDTEDDPTGRYVLFQIASDLTADSGDVETAFEAIDQMAEYYKIDVLDMQAKILIKAAGNKTLPSNQRVPLVESGLDLIDRAVAQDKHRLAHQVAVAITGLGRKTKDFKLLKRLVARKAEIIDLGRRYIKVKEALTNLEQNPTDSTANQTVGEYRCYVRGDWIKGLPMLALGSDKTLKTMAIADLKGASSAVGQVKLGNSWWKLAEASEGTRKKYIRWRAAHWYEKAMPGLTGLAKSVTQKRLTTIGEIPTSSAAASRTSGRLSSELKKGLVLYYDFNKEEKEKVTDKSGKDNHATVHGAKWIANARGPRNGAFAFDGSTAYLDAGNAESLKMENAVTVSAWVLPARFFGKTQYTTVFSDHGPAGNNGKIFRFGKNSIQFMLGPAGTTTVQYPLKALNVWYHLLVTFNGQAMQMYINGIKADAKPYQGKIKKNSNHMFIGKSGFREHFSGLIDEVMIYDRALSAKEVKQLYKAQGGK